MADRWEDLDVEIRNKIDGMSREELELHLREENPNSVLRQGIAGEYFEERYKGASGMSTDDFHKQMSLEREQEEEDDEGEVDDEVDQDDEDEEEPVKEEPGKPHFEDKKK